MTALAHRARSDGCRFSQAGLRHPDLINAPWRPVGLRRPAEMWAATNAATPASPALRSCQSDGSKARGRMSWASAAGPLPCVVVFLGRGSAVRLDVRGV